MTSTTGPKGSRNEHTKDKQQTKPASDAYREGYDRIFCKHEVKRLVPNTFKTMEECVKCGQQFFSYDSCPR